MDQISTFWEQIRAPLLVPLLEISAFLCVAMSIMLVVERVCMAVVILAVKASGKKPENKKYKWEAQKDDDVELGKSSVYPSVLVQIPMYNEREVQLLQLFMNL
ncbi:hypothetical protein M569_02193 [Genlisea aurea]|uniref:Glycosyltransferase 2-like domain-containing protein n=1 Tax=Genlisea aurea TaxID=192259 RepID=S8D571_9LAMI|nr:hypothetical protein M569_02193 [Genlisea aurea]